MSVIIDDSLFITFSVIAARKVKYQYYRRFPLWYHHGGFELLPAASSRACWRSDGNIVKGSSG